jgi:hypothetical protein
MAVFQHPHLTRGVVMTPKGAFVIIRGFVNAPDEIGDSLGWRRVDDEEAPVASQAQLASARSSAMRPDAMAPMDRQ